MGFEPDLTCELSIIRVTIFFSRHSLHQDIHHQCIYLHIVNRYKQINTGVKHIIQLNKRGKSVKFAKVVFGLLF